MRITITLEKDLISLIDSEAKEKGISRSFKIAQILREYDSTKHVLELTENRVKDLQSQLGFLQGEYSLITQRMLEPPEKIKRRWKF